MSDVVSSRSTGPDAVLVGRRGAGAPLPARTSRRAAVQFAASGAAVAALVLCAVLAPVLAPDDPDVGSLSGRLRPVGTDGHLLGTDGQGRDLLSRILWGARPSLMAGVIPVAIAGTVGLLLGIVAGLAGRRVENTVMRSLDVLFAFPAVLLAIAISASLGPGLGSLILALSIILVPAVARVVTTEVVRLRELDFMEAARASGADWWLIARKQVLPNILPQVIVYCSALAGLSIVIGAGLSFLGLGVAPPQAEWGSMLDELRQNLFTDPTLAMVPAAVIFVASIAFNLLGDGLSRRFGTGYEQVP